MRAIGTAVFVAAAVFVPVSIVGFGWGYASAIVVGVMWMLVGFGLADGEIFGHRLAQKSFNRLGGFLKNSGRKTRGWVKRNERT